ncbi:multidrug efflux RND transporter permease subunit [soil metagenome]
MIAEFFIDRRVLAGTISWMLLLLGGVSLLRLPVEQYPQITPPTVRVATVYPGASAQVVADTVASPIEQQVNGVERMLYMSSTSAADGAYGLTITFEIGTDLDKAQTLVQNRLNVAEAQLPEEVRRQGLVVSKQASGVMLVVSLTSDEPAHDGLFLANYAQLRLRDELARVPGVGEVQVYGAGTYSMRVWPDPDKLWAYSLTAQDVVRAIAEQNVHVAAGQVGQPPTPTGRPFQLSVTASGRLSDPAEFRRIVVKSGAAGQPVFLGDVARVELGGVNYDSFTQHQGREAAALLVYQLPGSNALEAARGVKAAMARFSERFPPGLAYGYPYDTTPFVDAAIHEVYKTLIEAGVLVLLVILLFLQDWRATLVPATTVPITIVGTFALMGLLGYSVNLLTLFGLVLAIGIVVDDAIVIVENVAHHIERGLPPREATVEAMREVTGPVIGMTLVLMAVFLPAAFLRGTTGQMYQQFALTIAATAALSAINALTLKPVQCAAWLRPSASRKNRFARAFDRCYGLVERTYVAVVRRIIRRPAAMLGLFVPMIALTGWGYGRLPSSFLPADDQGYAIVIVQLPDSASIGRTRAATDAVSAVLGRTPGVRTWMMLGGFSLLDNANASNAATCFVMFDPFDERTGNPAVTQEAIIGALNQGFADVRDAVAFAVAPPAIIGLGVAGGFEMQIEDREGVGLDELQRRTQEIVDAAQASGAVAQLTTSFRSGVPQLRADIDREKVRRLGLTLEDVFATLQAAFGSVYVNDFNKFGRTYQVRVQADGRFREHAASALRLQVRNRDGRMVPLGAVLRLRDSIGPQFVKRYNTHPSAAILGTPTPGTGSGAALAAMERVAEDKLPSSMGYEWTGISFEEKRVGGEAATVFALAVVMVYMVLAPLYESWILPLAVLLAAPLGLVGVVGAVMTAGIENNVYVQIGSVLIVALACKNAILIVEFARELRRAGVPIHEAALHAARQRLRPILMTSLAFIAGVLPLVFAEGAGAASRRSLGTAVFGGMISSTVLVIFFVPAAYVVAQRIDERRRGSRRAAPNPPRDGVDPKPSEAFALRKKEAAIVADEG